MYALFFKVWEKAGEQGILGVTTPAEQGGIGGDVLSTAITWEEQYVILVSALNPLCPNGFFLLV